ncbi:carbohydrate ABC transporter substrate-binding protein [Treponema phagedenis]|uniref:ABC transporter, solute-binding protein n=1 Tax=Treponema phagedenis TaxID=162 RepID=A0A0B7GZ18_TREPH|nr:hypothetical protein [Treponema phagedenis]QEJ94590.1 carbohydrate ABC transporter substrate-binding protein [Treponema phagedenis]QEK01531.1 carbohydrate ABC transporter substrate-binding protein [Treponema phagedenis]QEK06618.1 carbohydrate ABC transporter substrate-binding protein [Treponema phagedenis]QSI00790.1 carbohydrate ABC transporter substrate-binding protein [Treponema phagedenis]CEM62882.1 ABC transporter, solute-binding protein [Treponema phagedenis]
MRRNIVFVFGLLLSVFVFSCKNAEDSIAVIWTNNIDFVLYCELFNQSQKNYKIVVQYKTNPAQAVIEKTETFPDVVIGPWLKGGAARTEFTKIASVLGEDKIPEDSFYPELLQLGNINGNQYLLPVSFNLPTIIFSQKQANRIDSDFSLSLDEIRALSKEYNKIQNGIYTRMGFSPRWEDSFLYLTAEGFKASFEEKENFFTWNTQALSETVTYIRNWSAEVNTSAASEDDFKFRYLYDPPYMLITGGRCLFWYLPSDNLFAMSQDKLNNIDFRWITYKGKTPLQEDIVYAGIHKKARNTAAAKAFLIWFFSVDTQKELMEKIQEEHLIAQSFGIAGGFSALKNVTENVFPNYYPLLLKHLPQTNTFETPKILPSNWTQLKKAIVLPYLKEAGALPLGKSEENIQSLNKRSSEWYKNQQQ